MVIRSTVLFHLEMEDCLKYSFVSYSFGSSGIILGLKLCFMQVQKMFHADVEVWK